MKKVPEHLKKAMASYRHDIALVSKFEFDHPRVTAYEEYKVLIRERKTKHTSVTQRSVLRRLYLAVIVVMPPEEIERLTRLIETKTAARRLWVRRTMDAAETSYDREVAEELQRLNAYKERAARHFANTGSLYRETYTPKIELPDITITNLTKRKNDTKPT